MDSCDCDYDYGIEFCVDTQSPLTLHVYAGLQMDGVSIGDANTQANNPIDPNVIKLFDPTIVMRTIVPCQNWRGI